MAQRKRPKDLSREPSALRQSSAALKGFNMIKMSALWRAAMTHVSYQNVVKQPHYDTRVIVGFFYYDTRVIAPAGTGLFERAHPSVSYQGVSICSNLYRVGTGPAKQPVPVTVAFSVAVRKEGWYRLFCGTCTGLGTGRPPPRLFNLNPCFYGIVGLKRLFLR